MIFDKPSYTHLFMTDSVVNAAGGVQNPATYGTFPLFLEYARDRNLLSVEETIHKMTGASAARFQMKDRGTLKKGMAADWLNMYLHNLQAIGKLLFHQKTIRAENFGNMYYLHTQMINL